MAPASFARSRLATLDMVNNRTSIAVMTGREVKVDWMPFRVPEPIVKAYLRIAYLALGHAAKHVELAHLSTSEQRAKDVLRRFGEEVQRLRTALREMVIDEKW